MVYLDDILIFSEDVITHTKAVQKILKKLHTYKLYANLKKCAFNIDTVEFLGFIIRPTEISIDPSQVATI